MGTGAPSRLSLGDDESAVVPPEEAAAEDQQEQLESFFVEKRNVEHETRPRQIVRPSSTRKTPGPPPRTRRPRPPQFPPPPQELSDDTDSDDDMSDNDEVYDWCAFDTAQGLATCSPPPQRETPSVVTQATKRSTPPPPQRSPLSRNAEEGCNGIERNGQVKDTHEVHRVRASLPSELPHPMPTSGDYVKKRLIVNNYILLDVVGTGSYAEVRLCKEKTTDKLYAMKVMNKDVLRRKQLLPKTPTTTNAAGNSTREDGDDDDEENSMLDDVKREIAIMKKLSHPNVLRLYEVMDDPKVNKLYLVLEYMKRGDLMQMLQGDSSNKNKKYECDPMNERALSNVFRQVACGLEYLHLQNIIHGDIKPQNLLVGEDGTVKIADFGISKMLKPGEANNKRLVDTAGTPAFMCPEICAGESYSGPAADVWALGACMYMLRAGHPPFVADKVIQLYHKIIEDPLELPDSAFSPGLATLLQKMLEKDPANRASLADVVNDPWLERTTPKPLAGSTMATKRKIQAPATSANGPTSPTSSGVLLQQVVRNYPKITVTKGEVGEAITKQKPPPPPLRPTSTPKRRQQRERLCQGEEARRLESFAKKQSKPLVVRSPLKRRVDSLADDMSSDCELVDNSDDLDICFSARPLEDDEAEHAVIESSLAEILPCPADMSNQSAGVSCAFHSRRGQRNSQEDRVTVIPDLSAVGGNDLAGFGYVGVFDGHEGAACATFLQHELHARIVEDDLAFGRPGIDPRAALTSAFSDVDDAACRSLTEKEDASGSTALVAIIDRRRIVVAHAGDSRCVVSAAGSAVPLTRDHRLTRRDECARVQAAGGIVVNNRLNGTLAVSRSFGDVAHKNVPGHPPTVTPTPEVVLRNREACIEDEFVILATDGLWDALSMQAAVNFIRNQINDHQNLQTAVKALTNEALNKGAIDNVTVVVVLLR